MPHSSIQTVIVPWIEKWLQKVYRQNIHILSRFSFSGYRSDHHWPTIFGQYQLQFEDIGQPTLIDQQVLVPVQWQTCSSLAIYQQRQKAISKVFVKECLPQITGMVEDINRTTYQVEIGKIGLRYNSSRWGSCSTRGNITINSRLLLSNPGILRSVVIHELAHRIHANHSPAFWHEVKRFDPDYRQVNLWLKENGFELKF